VRFRPNPLIQECCLDVLRANVGTSEEGDRLICRGCDMEYRMHLGIWMADKKGSQ
jgi:hypothetical protein